MHEVCEFGTLDMRKVFAFFGSILVFSVRGLLLWIVIPGAFLIWLICSVPLFIFRALTTAHRPTLNVRIWVLWGVQFLDATISRLSPVQGLIQVPWPWVDPPREEDEHVLFDAW